MARGLGGLRKDFTLTQNLLLSKMRKWPYLGPGIINCKSKTTLVSSTLKVEGNKVVLFLQFKAQGPKYIHFLIFFLTLYPPLIPPNPLPM